MEMHFRIRKLGLSRRQWNILLGYNLPFVLWLLFAVTDALLGSCIQWSCPIHSLLGWCPGCGLTRALVSRITGRNFSNLWLNLILAGFLLNFLWSIRKISRG